MKIKHTSLVIISIFLCIALSSCIYVDKIRTRLYLDNSSTEITKYDPVYNPQDIPNELISILSRQTYPAVYVDEIEKNTYLVHDSRSKGFLNIQIVAKLRNQVLHIEISKRRTVDETSDNTPSELIAIIKVPEDKIISKVKLKNEFYSVLPQ